MLPTCRSGMSGSSASTASSASSSRSAIDLSEHLPLRLIKSETVPPAPNFSGAGSTTCIDWLLDFAGLSWVAYGASSLLVIHHMPSPLSHEENKIGTFYRQVFELSTLDPVSDVSAVSWSPEVPSNGDLAAAADNCVFLFRYDSEEGCFCWSQTDLLVQATKVEAIKWTGSGDGIITGGVEVVFWKRKFKAWEIIWKLEMKRTHNLVSTTWSIEGPSATAASSGSLYARGSDGRSKFLNDDNCVSLFHRDGKSGYYVSYLRHPQPLLMIQWRPSVGRCQTESNTQAPIYVLLTCCLDGTVRLWSEIDDGRPKKSSKDVNDSKISRRHFCVVGIIEINHALNGSLGSNISVTWATEISGIFHIGEGAKIFPAEGNQRDLVGRCDWLIGLGPGKLVTFWAVHCLEDVNPKRPPRLSIWRKHEIMGSEVTGSYDTSAICPMVVSFGKVAILRREVFGPPTVCSFTTLLPSNILCRSVLYEQTSPVLNDKCSPNSDTYSESREILNIGGHTGKILQVSVHPYKCEEELAVSLDSNGLLLFWSLSPCSKCISGLPTLNPSWEVLGHIVLEDKSHSMSLTWAPSWSDEDNILLSGHAQGVDCSVVNTSSKKENNIFFHKLCTIPFPIDSPSSGPDKIFSFPLRSTCKATSKFNEFMVIAVWMTGFQALSWKITLHSHDLSERCSGCGSDDNSEPSTGIFHSHFVRKRYHIFANLCSRDMRNCNELDQVACVAVVSPSILMSSLLKKWHLTGDAGSNYFAYHMVTGYYDGRVRLWKSNISDSLSSSPWELVGVFKAHDGPVSAISLADCGQKIATAGAADQSKNSSMLCLWKTVNILGGGRVVLEDKISLSEEALALRWLVMGNGQLFLGICLPNELRIYAQRCYRSRALLKAEKGADISTWFCISVLRTSLAIFDFLWGPRVTIVVIHEKYFSIYSQWSFLIDKKYLAECHPAPKSAAYFTSEVGKGILPVPFIGHEIYNFRNLLLEESRRACKASFHSIVEIGHASSSLFINDTEIKKIDQAKIGFLSMLEVAEILSGPLPFYHPEVLLIHIVSGNWKRAYGALQHLVECMTPSSASEKNSTIIESTPVIRQMKLSNYFDGAARIHGSNKGLQWSSDVSSFSLSSYPSMGQPELSNYSDASNATLSSAASVSSPSAFLETLERLHELAAVTTVEKMQTLAIIDLLHEIKSASAYESLDEPGRRFWCAIRLQQLDFLRKDRRLPSTEELSVHSRLMSWAFHSGCQENLFSAVLPAEPSWTEMRNMGVGFWFTDDVQLRAKMEKLARSQYLKAKDPKACALLYIALNKIQVLAGLFKLSKDEKDKPLVGFLSRNFQEEKNKAAALKNAYVLMGRHQLELAVAFFLLGGDSKSAVTVCAKNLGDEQLALVLCRLLEGQNGPLEHHLISKCLLPAAVEKGDCWLASVFQWLLGNYYQSVVCMIGLHEDSNIKESVDSSSVSIPVDPAVGQYCQMLAAKTRLRNAVGERNSMVLCRWATIMTASSLNRCGLPLEAVECMSSSASHSGAVKGRDSDNSEILPNVLRPYSDNPSNWLSSVVALHLETHYKSELVMQYLFKLLREHPSWVDTSRAFKQASALLQRCDINHYRPLYEAFQQNLNSALAFVEQRFSLSVDLLLNKILVSSYNYGQLLLGYHTLHCFTTQDQMASVSVSVPFTLDLGRQILDAATEFSYFFSKFVPFCGMATFQSSPLSNNEIAVIKRSSQFHALRFYLDDLLVSLCQLRAALLTLYVSSTEDFTHLSSVILDLCRYCVYFSSGMLLQDFKILLPMSQPPLLPCNEYYLKDDMVSTRGALRKFEEFLGSKLKNDFSDDNLQADELSRHEQDDSGTTTMEDERHKISCVCLWQYVSSLVEDQVEHLSDELRRHNSDTSHVNDSSSSLCPREPRDYIQLIHEVLEESIRNTISNVSSYNARQLALFLWQKVKNGAPLPSLQSLEELIKAQPVGSYALFPNKREDNPAVANEEPSLLLPEMVSKISSDPTLLMEALAHSGINLSELGDFKPFVGWKDLHNGIVRESDNTGKHNHQDASGSTVSWETSSPSTGGSHHVHIPSQFSRKESGLHDNNFPFQNPREVFRKSGELLEAVCVNSINERQVAVAGNRKGIMFFNWDDGLPLKDQSNYIWSEMDWPRDGWAAAESTPVPTCVSPGVGLGDKEGARLGLGGATIGVGSFTSPGRDLTGGGAFGIPGYAGIGASGLGWEIQEEFDNFVDPLATLENTSARALASHPSIPLFLVGSVNTHIYLWEFGKDRATATYGVLPAANVPPPYALASVTALRFDHGGNRFANAASDGTVCTWQLEVGGKCNVRPAESSLCFNGHTSDVCYVGPSGCILAAAGYSSNGVNVVIWDTLAPPSTSRASVMCHEGGATSVAVFNNEVGGSSASPLIITGGKGGDIGLHDFRYIATGKIKRPRHPSSGNSTNDAPAVDGRSGRANMGDHNRNGMLWYIPKAHSGRITRICAIPDTSLFLTGSKDGDVKLWDAKRANLVFQWPKLHERHTFLQRGSQGFAGVERVGVTDIRSISTGFLSCGGDGLVKCVQLNDSHSEIQKH